MSKKSHKKSSPIKRLFKFGFVAGIWAVILGLMVCMYYYLTLPDISDIKLIEQNAGVEIYDRAEQRIARFGQTRGKTVSVDAMPEHMKQAVIAIEDHRFYDHPGIDLIGITRAMLVNIREGGFVEGGSTLTQQLAKNLFLKPEKTIGRKIQEAMLSLWLESELTKDEILTAYLNRVYFGSGAYGVTAAANRYFNKTASELTLPESAQLAAALKAPSRVNPIANPADSVARASLVLAAMAEQDFITEAQKQAAITQLETKQTVTHTMAADSIPHYFTDWVLDQVNNYATGIADGLNIYTGHDSRAYESAMKHITALFETRAAEKNIGQVALVLMEYDGTIRLIIGGRSYAESQFNRATQAERQPGSAFKPIVYLAALRKGHEPSTLVYDAPFEKGGDTGTYTPDNYADKYFGEVPLSEALARSLNTAAVRVADDAGMRLVIDTAKNLGITTPIKPELASALGASEARLIELTAAYAVIANGGRAVYPTTILRMEDKTGEIIYTRGEDVLGPRMFDGGVIRDMKYMLNGVMRYGTGRAAYLPDVGDQGGKTGTSQDFRDAWFIGYADGYVMGIWMGNDDNTPMNHVTGGSEPARLWHAVMRDVLDMRPVNYRKSVSMGWGGIGLFDNMIRSWTSDEVMASPDMPANAVPYNE